MEIDCSLLEISGEDDSLLQNQSDDVSVFNASQSPFSCSPLLHRSDSSLLTPAEKGNELMDNRILNQSMEKENKCLNQPKLSVEGQQMKRKKKGGYNLRKSLAWNRAFFTEEGVLSSSELSLISGNLGNSSGETLSVIHEDGESEMGAVGSPSVALQALEKKLFKELPVNSPSVTLKRKQNLHSPLFTSRSGSKSKFGGCPKPVVSSSLKRPGTVNSTSLKRPANVNMSKGTSKESKVSKLPVSKVDSSILRTSSKNVEGTSKAKRDQIAKPDKNQKIIRSPGHSLERKEAPKTLLPKFSSHQDRNRGSSTSRTRLAAGIKSSAVSKTENGIKENSKQDHVTVDSVTNGHDVVSNDRLSLNCGNFIGEKQQVQQQTAKPSRLRMPSPSLGFFDQLKTAAASNLSQDSNKNHGSQSSIPTVRKFGVQKFIGSTGNRKPGVPSAVQSVPSTVTTTVGENVKATYRGSKLMVDIIKGPVDRNNRVHEITNSEQQSGLGDVEQHNKDVKLQNKLVNQSGLSEEVKEEKGPNVNHIEGESQEVRVVKSSVDNECGSAVCGSSTACEDFVNMINDVNGGQADRLSPSANSNHHNCQGQYNGSSATRTEKFRDLHLENSVEYEPPCSNTGCSSGELRSFYSSAHGIDRKKEKIGASDSKDKSGKFMDKNECIYSSVETVPFSAREQFSDVLMSESQSLVHDATKKEFRGVGKLESSVEYELPCSNIGGSSGKLESFYCSTHSTDGRNEKIGASDSKDKSGKFMDKNECIHSSSETLPFSAREQFSDVFMSESQSLVHDAIKKEFRGVGKLENSVEYELLCSNIGCSYGELESFYCSTHSIDGRNEIVGASDRKDKTGQFMDKNECIHSSSETLPFSAREQFSDVFMSESQSSVHDATKKEFRGVGKLENSVEYELPCSNIGCSSGELESFYCSTHSIDGRNEIVGASDRKDKTGQFMDENECILSSVETLPFSAREQFCDVSMSESQNLVHDATNEEFAENPAVSDSCPEAPKDFQAQLTEFVLHREIISSEQLADSDKNEFAVNGTADSSDCKLEDSTVTSTPPLTMQYQHTDLGSIDLRGKHVSEIREASSKEVKKIEEVELVGLPNAIGTNNNSQLQRDLPRCESGSLLSADCSIHARLAELDSGVEDENCPTVLVRKENKSSADNHCAVSTLVLDENISCQQGIQVSIDDVVLLNAVHVSSNQLGDEEKPQLEGTTELGYQAASFLHDLPSLTGEQDIGPVTSSSSRTIYPSTGDSRLVVEDFDEIFISREYDSPSLRKEQNQWPVESYNSFTVCPLEEDTGLEIEADQTILFGDLLQYEGVKMRNSNCSEKEAEIDVSGVEMIQEPEKASEPVAKEHLTQKSGNDKTEAPATVKPPPSAVPFSDEWLEAFEAAGEEILAKKGGAVQNSPTDKSLPEPGPWSPVKRKSNQEIGPFDCTKYTNTNAPGSNER